MLSGSSSRILNVNRMDVAYRSTSGTNPPTSPPSEEKDEVVLLASVMLKGERWSGLEGGMVVWAVVIECWLW